MLYIALHRLSHGSCAEHCRQLHLHSACLPDLMARGRGSASDNHPVGADQPGGRAALHALSFYYVFDHKLMKHPYFIKHLHKQHHIFKIPTPFASHAFHPLDGFQQSLPYHVYPFIFPLHKIWMINGAAHHVDHHLFFNYNYGQYFTLWDKSGGSYRYPSALLQKGPYDNIRKLMKEAVQTQ
ncbi:Lathosterol oxidase [Collichthys lucidus]|uniref:Lathosterol oxidase n=1 Tax=Collichthys lucidus TaxID=240159 RepID=A0A4V6ARK0_COLLU|nr:Lathosterol oxidase [Collichthys lucidus]